jgi:primosomal replication protein N
VAKALQKLGVGGQAIFRGFLTHQRNGRGFIAHVTVIEPAAPAEPGSY